VGEQFDRALGMLANGYWHDGCCGAPGGGIIEVYRACPLLILKVPLTRSAQFHPRLTRLLTSGPLCRRPLLCLANEKGRPKTPL